jgi:hypothetical protein
MRNREELCRKITEMHPEIGECGLDIDVTLDEGKKVWVVNLKREGHELRHHLEYSDADSCMDGEQCVSLGLEIAQLKKNIMGEQF